MINPAVDDVWYGYLRCLLFYKSNVIALKLHAVAPGMDFKEALSNAPNGS